MRPLLKAWDQPRASQAVVFVGILGGYAPETSRLEELSDWSGGRPTQSTCCFVGETLRTRGSCERVRLASQRDRLRARHLSQVPDRAGIEAIVKAANPHDSLRIFVERLRTALLVEKEALQSGAKTSSCAVLRLAPVPCTQTFGTNDPGGR